MNIKKQLEASLLLDKLGCCILAGEDAVQAFDECGNAQLAEIMRRQNVEAFNRLEVLLRLIRRINEGDTK